jgi:D-alanyl-D-alanine carboxypeptidase/D-alanyl-D-alanine-endopeptidase (penicillin-binding protein 4)
MKRTICIIILLGILSSCGSVKSVITKDFNSQLASPFYKNHFTGLLVIDAGSKDTVYNLNSHKYFIPASNTKIFTLFTSLKTLPNHIPALEYIKLNDTLYFEGTGDPSFLHPYLKDSTALNFLNKHHNIVYSPGNFEDEKYGPGWAWDDYQWYYSPEKSNLPIHGNVVMTIGGNEMQVTPSYFKDSVFQLSNKRNRNEFSNTFFYNAQSKDTVETPFITSNITTKSILENLLNKKVSLTNKMPVVQKQTLYGLPIDSLYKRMMHESDNFIAEQLLLVAGSVLKDTLNSKVIRDYILKNELYDLEQEPRWVDGSGLSRYNLFTPQNMVSVLERLFKMVPKEKLYKIFPAGGMNGTLRNRFINDDEPFIYAKSGSLSNNYCLSGYLITKTGKTLIFSFMSNHFRESTSDVKTRLEQMLLRLRNTY